MIEFIIAVFGVIGLFLYIAHSLVDDIAWLKVLIFLMAIITGILVPAYMTTHQECDYLLNTTTSQINASNATITDYAYGLYCQSDDTNQPVTLYKGYILFMKIIAGIIMIFGIVWLYNRFAKKSWRMT